MSKILKSGFWATRLQSVIPKYLLTLREQYIVEPNYYSNTRNTIAMRMAIAIREEFVLTHPDAANKRCKFEWYGEMPAEY